MQLAGLPRNTYTAPAYAYAAHPPPARCMITFRNHFNTFSNHNSTRACRMWPSARRCGGASDLPMAAERLAREAPGSIWLRKLR